MYSAIFWTSLTIAIYTAVAAAIITILRRPREPRAMIIWVMVLVFLPVVGLVFFVLMGDPRIDRARRRRHRKRRRIEPSLSGRTEALQEAYADRRPPELPPELRDLMTFTKRLSGRPATHGNAVTIFHDAEVTYDAIREAIEEAQSHVHLEYFIFQPDETGRMFRDLLLKKVAEGVRCRLLVDYVGCWWWPRSFLNSLLGGGVEVGFFLPMVPWRNRWRINFRNHRKIVVVDGRIGFTGSQNIGDEYRGRLKKYAPWRDTHMKLVGPAVHQLQEIFVEDWHYATGVDLVEDDNFPGPEEPGTQTVQVIPSGPDSNARIMHQMLMSAVATAKESVCLITPYFVPDTTMTITLQSAAYRGVRVQLLIPSRSNHRLALWAGRSFYQELSSAGVEVYEYPEGLLHSKVIVVDGAWAMVGSANMDQRSFRINYEVTTVLYDQSLAQQLLDDFESLRNAAHRLTPLSANHWTYRQSLLLGLARLASPLL